MLVIGVCLDHQEAARQQGGTYPLHYWAVMAKGGGGGKIKILSLDFLLVDNLAEVKSLNKCKTKPLVRTNVSFGMNGK
jgi:hypothetical protein